MPAKKKQAKKTIMVGSGFMDFLKKAGKTALKGAAALGIKPSDVITALTKDKTGLAGTLGSLGASLAKQAGHGNFKKGDRVKECGCMHGSGFFGDLWGGVKSVLKPVASIAAPIVSAVAPEFAPLAMGANALLGNGGPSSRRMKGGCGVGFSNAYTLRSAPTMRLV